MKRRLPWLFLLPLFFCMTPLFGQEFSMGAILDPVRYEQVDAKPVLVSRNYGSLPKTVSLKQYSPVPESQGQFGTCAGWSTAFAARTISESIALGRTDKTLSSNNVFSPIYVYKNISNDPTGQSGTYINAALNLMKERGAVKRLPNEKTTDFLAISLSMFNNARPYPIADYVRLFPDYQDESGTIEDKVIPVQKSLAEKKPVVIGMKCPPSFHQRGKDLWQPWESPNGNYSGHAMCVVGYDDTQYGGAFEVQNSWGTDWGDNGYIWIKYDVFAAFVFEAYEMIENLAMYKDATRYAASIEIEVSNSNRGMPVSYDKQGFYKTRRSYPPGTQFRFLMTNKYPAYVYAFSADSRGSDIERIFPGKGVSPVLDYTDSTIAWPGEHTSMILENTSGTDYLIVLYSKGELNIGAIERRFADEKGTFPQRVARAVGSNFIPYSEVRYNNNVIEFSTMSTNPKAVFALLLAIDNSER